MSKRSDWKQWKKVSREEREARNAAPSKLAHEKRQRALRECERWLKLALHPLAVAGYTPWQMSFLKSIESQIRRGWPLTPKQRRCLDRIYPFTTTPSTRTGQRAEATVVTTGRPYKNPIRGPNQRSVQD